MNDSMFTVWLNPSKCLDFYHEYSCKLFSPLEQLGTRPTANAPDTSYIHHRTAMCRSWEAKCLVQALCKNLKTMSGAFNMEFMEHCIYIARVVGYWKPQLLPKQTVAMATGTHFHIFPFQIRQAPLGIAAPQSKQEISIPTTKSIWGCRLSWYIHTQAVGQERNARPAPPLLNLVHLFVLPTQSPHLKVKWTMYASNIHSNHEQLLAVCSAG